MDYEIMDRALGHLMSTVGTMDARKIDGDDYEQLWLDLEAIALKFDVMGAGLGDPKADQGVRDALAAPEMRPRVQAVIDYHYEKGLRGMTEGEVKFLGF